MSSFSYPPKIQIQFTDHTCVISNRMPFAWKSTLMAALVSCGLGWVLAGGVVNLWLHLYSRLLDIPVACEPAFSGNCNCWWLHIQKTPVWKINSFRNRDWQKLQPGETSTQVYPAERKTILHAFVRNTSNSWSHARAESRRHSESQESSVLHS